MTIITKELMTSLTAAVNWPGYLISAEGLDKLPQLKEIDVIRLRRVRQIGQYTTLVFHDPEGHVALAFPMMTIDDLNDPRIQESEDGPVRSFETEKLYDDLTPVIKVLPERLNAFQLEELFLTGPEQDMLKPVLVEDTDELTGKPFDSYVKWEQHTGNPDNEAGQ